MTISISRASYTDCYELMDVAIADSRGIRYGIKAESIAKAIDNATFLRMRMHQARKLDRDQNKEIYERDHPMWGCSVYDKLTVRIKNIAGDIYLYLEQSMVNISNAEPLSMLPEIDYEPVPQIEYQPIRQIEDKAVEIAVPKVQRRL